MLKTKAQKIGLFLVGCIGCLIYYFGWVAPIGLIGLNGANNIADVQRCASLMVPPSNTKEIEDFLLETDKTENDNLIQCRETLKLHLHELKNI